MNRYSAEELRRLTARLKAGAVVHLTHAASPQFTRPIFVRVIRVLDWSTYDGWKWVEGYELNQKGDAVARRTLFVYVPGVRWMTKPALPSTPAARRPPLHTRVVGR